MAGEIRNPRLGAGERRRDVAAREHAGDRHGAWPDPEDGARSGSPAARLSKSSRLRLRGGQAADPGLDDREGGGGLCREASSPMLANHCFRTYAWGMILGQSDGLRPDPELFYVASLLHDLALTDQFRDYAPMPCFGARAGILANDWAGERGWPAHRCSHLGRRDQPSPERKGPRRARTRGAAAAGGCGPRCDRASALGVDAPRPSRRWSSAIPRHDMKRASHPVFEAESHPRTRAQPAERWLMSAPATPSPRTAA